jgi:hypothetical protein
MDRDEHTHVREWAELVGETVSEEAAGSLPGRPYRRPDRD